MAAHSQTQTRPQSHHPVGHRQPAGHHAVVHHHLQHPRLLDRCFLGVSWRYWVVSGIVLGLCLSIYEADHAMMAPTAFDQPGAQVPNKLRSSWGVQNPL
ncbi:MAG TPA: hypothetical protein VGP48_04915 [Stellaceae bacterium]|jgi:hypothetical protein|nr:hypothetical protein [Stellaceae bacterium]